MKIFAILSRVPYPLDKGDKLRAYHQLIRLSKEHDVHVVCLDDNKTSQAHIDTLSKDLNVTVIRTSRLGAGIRLFMGLFGSKPYQVNYFYRPGAHRKVKAMIAQIKPDHIYCQLIRVAEYVKHEHSIPKTLDYMDAFSKGMERRVKEAKFPYKMFYRSEAKRLLAYENLIFEYFEHKTIISTQDRDLIYHNERKQIEVVPNGVDFDFFKPIEKEKKHEVVFTGNMNYAPNVDSAVFLVKMILPLVHKQIPNAHFLIAGANPAPNVQELASKDVTVTGWVDDIRDSYASSKVMVAAMNIGTGLQNKLLEAMAMGIPCVTSALANNALAGTHNYNILIADGEQAFADHIVALL
ncbi:MAG: glycosyltransferase, partial [Thalassobium sp.]